MKLSIVYKISLTSVFLVVISAAVIGGLFYTKTADLLIAHSLEDIDGKIRNAGSRLRFQIDAQNKNIRLLADTPPIQGMLRALKSGNYDSQGKSTFKQWNQRLQSIFSIMLETNPNYLKLRFIDKSGQELTVVGRGSKGIEVLTDAQLQNKFHRSYMKNTLTLPSGSTYLSEIHLNREYGKITEPYQEVLRSATPVYDEESKEIAGLLLITAEIGHVLREIQDSMFDLGTNIYITNDHGGYLLHPDRHKTYGFDLGKRYRIQEDLPYLAALFMPGNSAKEMIILPHETDDRHVVSTSKIFLDPARSERFIAVIMTHSYADIVSNELTSFDDVFISAFILVIAGAILSVLLSVRVTRPIVQITQVMDDYTNDRVAKTVMPVSQHDEIGLLARSYQKLIKRVDDAQDKLEFLNQGLELNVNTRTKELELSEMRQRIIVENIVDGLITISNDGIVTSFNPAACKIFNYLPEEVIGKNISMLMPEPYQSSHDGYLQSYQHSGIKKIIGFEREVLGRRKDGGVFPMELAVSEMMVDEQIIYSGLVRDISERKQMDKMKNEFISMVSHELRTPLTSIRGSLGLIIGIAIDKVPEQVQELLKIASKNTERLLLLINDILDIQKMESGEMAFQFKNLDLVEFLNQTLEENAAYGEQYKVRFEFHAELNRAQVFADSDRMQQVMSNLLSNAAKFSPEGDIVRVSLARHDDRLRISVTDHGSGIPDEFQPKLFKKFTQADSSNVRQKGGTGLGLSISEVIIEKHGGQIGFVTKKDIGSTFYFDLPELMGDIDTDESTLPRRLPSNNISKILVIEDDADVAALLKSMLAETGYLSDIASDVPQARKLLKRNHRQYKLITLDLILPGEDGLSFLDELRSNDATKSLPVVVVSVEADQAKRKLKGGAVDFVDWMQKPIDQLRLVEAVNKAVGSNDRPRVLHVGDEDDAHKVVSLMLHDYCDLIWTKTLKSSRDALKSQKLDLVLLDIELLDGSGLELLETIEQCVMPPRVVIFSAHDVGREYSNKVNAVLIKSRTDYTQLSKVIISVIQDGVI